MEFRNCHWIAVPLVANKLVIPFRDQLHIVISYETITYHTVTVLPLFPAYLP